MIPEERPSEPEAPTSKGRRLLGYLGWAVAANLLMLIAAFVGFDWWAGRALEDARQPWVDAGLAGEFRDLVPAPVPEAENFGAQPLLLGAGEPGAEDGDFEKLWDSLSCGGSLGLNPLDSSGANPPDLSGWLRALEECGKLPFQMMAGCTWIGVEAGAFDPDQLVRLRGAMDRVKLRKQLVDALQFEALTYADTLALTASGEVPSGLGRGDFLVPAAFWEANAARLLNGMREHYLVPLRDQGWRPALASAETYEEAKARRKERYDLTEFVAGQTTYVRTLSLLAVLDTGITLAMAACAVG